MSNNTEILTAALDYANRGFHVFPVHGIVNGKCTCGFPGCKPPNSGKHPATKSGLKDATTDAAIIRAWFERSGWNVAIRTGAESRIWVLDIDGAQGEESLNNLENIHGKLPATMESTTGRGRHLIWKHTGEELKNSASKIGLKIDARGDSGYIVAPPSNHHSGAVYTLNDAEAVYAPDWLFDLASGAKAKAERVYAVPDAGQQTGEWDVADVRNMLSALDPDMEYMEWVRVGMALHEGNYSVLLWDEWSRSGKKYQSGDCVKRWRGFTPGGGVSMGTLVAKAQDYGWTPRRAEEDTVATEIAARIHARFVEKERAGKKAVALKVDDLAPLEVIKSFPNPTEVGGIVGDTVRWILETAIKPQPELALLHVITALGAVFGRRYKGQGRFDTRTNLYTIGIAGTGCHARGTKILMFDGTIKSVEEIKSGELLMGDDSTPRKVNFVISGSEEMFRITPVKGDSFVVNKNHVLSLQKTGKSDTINIKLSDYMQKNKKFRNSYKLRKKSVNFNSKKRLPVPPWFLGAFLGDGHFGVTPAFAAADLEIVSEIEKYAKEMGISVWSRELPNGNKARDYRFSEGNKGANNFNKLGSIFKSLGLSGKRASNKFIPHIYKTSSRKNRLEILAGLLDTDGYLGVGCFDFISKSKQLAEDVVFISRSLGLSANIKTCIKHCQNNFSAEYFRVSISGDTEMIPTRCKRKRANKRKQIKNPLVTGFKIEKIGIDNFYGFNLDSNHLYLTADFVVHHNSGKEHSRKQMSVLMNQAGLVDFIGAGRFISDAGLITALQKKPSQIMPIDEIGMVLQMISDKKASGFLKNIATHLLTLYSSSGSFFNAGQYADIEKDEIVIPCPNLCIYGTTTLESYAKALTSDSITSGEMNRFVVIPVSEKIPKRNRNDECETTPPHGLLTQWESLKPVDGLGALNDSMITPTPIIVVWNKEIGLRMENMGDIEDSRMRENLNGMGGLWNRYKENITKIAMIFAIARNQQRPEIISADLDIAEGILQRSINYMTEICLENVADSEYQRNCQKVFTFIRTEKQVSLGRLANNIRSLKAKEIKEILESLEDQEKIEIGLDPDTSKKKRGKIIRLK